MRDWRWWLWAYRSSAGGWCLNVLGRGHHIPWLYSGLTPKKVLYAHEYTFPEVPALPEIYDDTHHNVRNQS